jgi:membrane protein
VVFGDFLSVARRRFAHPWPLVEYLLLTTQTHALCGSLAFFAMLGFYPLSLLLISLAKYVLRSPEALGVVKLTVYSYFPVGQDFLLRNLEASSRAYGDVSALGALWILLGGGGVFIPLETAFNQLWGFGKHRPYWHNQLVGLALTTACWALLVGLVVALGHLPLRSRAPALPVVVVVVGAVALFLVYRFLPHGRVPTAAALPAAVFTALAAEAVRHVFLFVLPRLNLQASHGPFHVSVSFLVFVYVESFVLLAGAYLAAEATGESSARQLAPPASPTTPPPARDPAPSRRAGESAATTRLQRLERLRSPDPAGGLARLAGGWRGSEELVRLLAGSRRSRARRVPR